MKKKEIEKQLEYLNNKRILMPKMYSFEETRELLSAHTIKVLEEAKEYITDLQTKVSDPDSKYIAKLPKIKILDEVLEILSDLIQKEKGK